MFTKLLPSQEELKTAFDYDAETGILTWRRRADRRVFWNTRYGGNVAGTVDKTGHVVVNLEKRNFFAHRVIWKMITGEEPDREIDHIDNDPANNRWINLRAATRQQNLMNAGLHEGKTLPKGVSKAHSIGKYRASIRLNNKCQHLGTFETIEAAHAAYRRAAVSGFGEFARFA